MDRQRRFWIGVGIFGGLVVLGVLVLRLCGILIPYRIPTDAMSPALKPGDHIIMEGMSCLVGAPVHGDVVVFKTDGIQVLPQNLVYTMRVAAIPGDRLQIVGGKLFINDQLLPLRNAEGEIRYDVPAYVQNQLITNITIPPGQYFVLGDNSTNSHDSRFWGTVPAKNIKGCVWLRYYPLDRIGGVK